MKRIISILMTTVLTLTLLPFHAVSAYESVSMHTNYAGITDTISNPEADTQLPAHTDRYENIGIGAGGSFFLPMVDPANSNNYYVTCDMGGLYFSYDNGASWHRTETRGVLNEACIAEDGTLFAGGYGLYTSTDHGQTLELIYPKNVQYSVNRCGWNENLMLADGFDNGYLVGVTTSADRVWFATIDWYGNFRLMSADYNGDNLSILHTEKTDVSSPISVNLSMEVQGDGLFYTLANKLLYYSFADQANTVLYTARGKLLDFKKI